MSKNQSKSIIAENVSRLKICKIYKSFKSLTAEHKNECRMYWCLKTHHWVPFAEITYYTDKYL